VSPSSDPPRDSRSDSGKKSSDESPDNSKAESPAASPREEPSSEPGNEARPESSAEHGSDSGGQSRDESPQPRVKPRGEPGGDSQLIGSLAEQFRVIGELRGPTGVRRFVAVRNDNHGEVLIDVIKVSDAVGNDLAHFASDVQLRSTMSHPKVPPILEGRWLDANGYACVSERIKGDTLQERLDRGDRPGTAEVATILNDVKAVLDWARAGSIVHRGVSPDSIIIEQDTNRLLVTLTPTPIPLAGLPGEVADARTLGALAWSLFTGRRFVDDDTRPPLGELCPNLAARVADATERILRARGGDRAPDAAAFIGIVAVGDVLKQAEVEFAALDEEFASHFTGDRTDQPSSEAPERLLTGRSPGARESIFALGTIAALVLLIALGVGLAGRQHRNSTTAIVARQMPTVPAAGQVDSGAAPMRNDSILTHSAAGSVADSTLRAQDSILRQNAYRDSALRDSVMRDSVMRDRIGRSRRMRDSVERDSLDRDNARRDSLDEDAYKRDSVRNAFRSEARRDSVRRDSIQRQLMRSDSAKIDSLRSQALRQDSIRRETAKRDSIRRDSVRRDTIPRRPPDSTRPPPDSIRPDSIGRPPPTRPPAAHGSRGTTG
jgi:serine/threonine protein kinase